MPTLKPRGKTTRPARNKAPPPKTPAASRGDRIKAVCKDITGAMSVIDMCRHAAASLYEHDDPETMYEALTLARDKLKTSIGTLQMIAKDEKGSP